MRYMKKLSVVLIALGLSAPVLSNNIVSIPSQHGGFKIAVDPLYLHKNAANTANDSTYDWGIYSEIGYLFAGTGNDVTVDYTSLSASETDSMDLDTVNVEVGQRLIMHALDVRLFSGIRYANLNYGLDINTAGNKQSLTNLFHGFGPRIGLDARYQFLNCFGIDAHINTSLLVGTLDTTYKSNYRVTSNSLNRIVPEMDAKMGIDYTYFVPGNSKSAIVFEVGYQTSNYFNALDNTLVNSSGDASFDGAYLDIKYYS